MPIPIVHAVVAPLTDDFNLPHYDAVVVVAPTFIGEGLPLQSEVFPVSKVDASFGKDVHLIVTPKASGSRLITSPTGSLQEDTDDVRKIADAAKKGILRAKAAGAKKPLLVLRQLPIDDKEFVLATQVALLGAYEALYERLQAREALGEKETETVEELGLLVSETQLEDSKNIISVVRGIEEGRRLARDIGGPDPERMSPIRAAAFIQQAFVSHSDYVSVSIVEDDATLHKEYPLLHAVSRASLVVSRQKPVVVRLEYRPKEGTAEETVLIAGKGVTYDTGGVDLKVGGFMSGMSRDKCGAAAAAGLVLTAAITKPAVRIIAELGFVRNSIGADAFVSDEIITSHAGVRCLIGNTDAEGRLVLADCLSHLREKVLKEDIKNPRFFSIATLTGHVVRAYGPYTAAVENAPARNLSLSHTLQKLGQVWGEPLEVSTFRREDVAFVAPKNNTYDVLQANTLPSSQTARGHQFPVTFLQKASGLSEHGKASKKPYPYTHLDIAGSAMADLDYIFGKPTGTPIVALAAQYLLPHLSAAAKFALKL